MQHLDYSATGKVMELLNDSSPLRKLFWACIGVAALFGVAAVLQGIGAIRWW